MIDAWFGDMVAYVNWNTLIWASLSFSTLSLHAYVCKTGVGSLRDLENMTFYLPFVS